MRLKRKSTVVSIVSMIHYNSHFNWSGVVLFHLPLIQPSYTCVDFLFYVGKVCCERH